MSEHIENPKLTTTPIEPIADGKAEVSDAPSLAASRRRGASGWLKRISFDEVGVVLALIVLSAIIGVFHPDFLAFV